MRDIILIGVVFLASPVALFRPFFGLLFFVFLGIFNPHSMTWSMARTLPLSQLVAVPTILGGFFSGEIRKVPNVREVYTLLSLWCVFAFSTLIAFIPKDAFSHFIHVSKILLMIGVAVVLTNSRDRLYSLIRVIGLSLGFYGLKGGIFALATGGQFLVYGPEDSFLEANNSIGLALAMNIPILIQLIKMEQKKWLLWIMRLMLLFSYPAVICTYSRGAWLGLAIVSALAVLKFRHKFLAVATAGILIVLLLPALPGLMPERLVTRYDSLVNYQEDSSAQSRLWNWEFCKRVGMANPLTGAGFNYYSLESYAIYYPEFQERYPGKVWSCHSIWLTVFSEHGLPGLVLWFGLLLSCLFSLRRIRSYAMLREANSWAAPYVDMVQSALVAYMVVGTFLDAAYFDLFYFLIAVIIVVKDRMQAAAIEEMATAIVSRTESLAHRNIRQPLTV